MRFSVPAVSETAAAFALSWWMARPIDRRVFAADDPTGNSKPFER
ncbi:hypothetical protein RCH17_000949 [Arthrobacter sp. MP_M7]|nr:hypothetical protein [Arthrobacter sp. MP_M4]MEC5202161.1 hypothetical protein [Arthrobacter sp. MP_M7]